MTTPLRSLRRHLLPVVLLSSVALLGACSQGSDADSTADTAAAPPSAAAPSTAASADTAAGVPTPEPFASGDVTVALVRQLSSGDYFEQWLAGAKSEAEKLGVQLDVSSADGNNEKQALNLENAVNQKVDAVIVDHGFAETIQPAVKKAVAAEIPVVAFDVDAGDPGAVTISQDDNAIASQTLDVLKQDTAGKAEVLYVYVAGFAPLDRRNDTWTEFKTANPGIEEVAKIGVVNESTASAVADQAKAALQANPGVTAVFAPYDEFAKGVTLAVQELGLQDKVKIYGADVSTADIAVITAAKSPWVATSATDPANVGRVAVRAAALLVAGEDVETSLIVPPALLTQADLTAKAIKNQQQLTEAFPELTTPDVAPVPWAPATG